MTNCFTITAHGVTDGIGFQRGPVFTKKDGLAPRSKGRPALWLGGDERNGNDRVTLVHIEDAPEGNQVLSGTIKRSKTGIYRIIAGAEHDIVLCIRTGFPTQLGAHTAIQTVMSESPKACATARIAFGSWTHEVPDTKKVTHACFDELWRLTEGTSIIVNFANDAFIRYSMKKGVLIETVLVSAKQPANVAKKAVKPKAEAPQVKTPEPQAAPAEAEKVVTTPKAKKPVPLAAAKKSGHVVIRDFADLGNVYRTAA